MDPITIVIGALALVFIFGGKGGKIPGASPPLPGTQEGNALLQLAQQLEAEIVSRGKSYDPNLLRAFQAGAKIVVDGLYGPESALALARVLGHTAPAPIFSGAPGVEQPPSTPPSSSELDTARKVAAQVALEITAKRSAYDHNLVRNFQKLARLMVDGLYGPATAGAVAYFTDSAPPTPLYKGKDGTYNIVAYLPPR